jgi:hypothetical protein
MPHPVVTITAPPTATHQIRLLHIPASSCDMLAWTCQQRH